MTAVASLLPGVPSPLSTAAGGALAPLEVVMPGFAAMLAAALPGSASLLADDAGSGRRPATPQMDAVSELEIDGAIGAQDGVVPALMQQADVTVGAIAQAPDTAPPRRHAVAVDAPVTAPTGGRRVHADAASVRRRIADVETMEPAATAPVAPVAVVAVAGPAKAVPVAAALPERVAKSPALDVEGAVEGVAVTPVAARSAAPTPERVGDSGDDGGWRVAVDTALRRVAPPVATLVPWIMAGMPPVARLPRGGVEPVVVASGEAPVLAAPVAMPVPIEPGYDRDAERGGEESFLPSPRLALAVLDAVSNLVRAPAAPTAAQALAVVPVPLMFDRRSDGGAPLEASVSDTAASLQSPTVAPAGAAPALAVRAEVDAPRRDPAAPADVVAAPAAATPQLGEVRIGVDGSAQALRVTLSVGSGAASVLADAPRLAADLAATGLRLQALEVSDAGAALSGGGTGGWSAASGGEGRPRFAPPPAVAANAFANEPAALLPQRARPASDRYA